MYKTYAEVAMEVIREDWEYQKSQNNPSFSQEPGPGSDRRKMGQSCR